MASSGAFERIFREGSTIELKDEAGNPVFCIIRQGAVAVELDIQTPKGIQTFQMGLLEHGETFNEDCLFGDRTQESPVRYRAKTKCVIMRLMRDMLPKNIGELTVVFESMSKTKANQDRKQREFMAYLIQCYEESLAKSADEQASLAEELAECRQELAATTMQIASAQENLEAVRLKAAENYRELQDYKTLTDTVEGLNKKLNRELKATREKELIKTLMAEIERAQKATQSSEKALRDAKEHGLKIARALERLGNKNPGLILDEATIALLLGEEPSGITAPPPRAQSDDDIDRAFEEFLHETPARLETLASDEAEPAQTLIPPDSGVPGATLRTQAATAPPKLQQFNSPLASRGQCPVPRPYPILKHHAVRPPPLPRNDDGYAPRAPMATLAFDPEEMPTEPARSKK